MNRILLLTALIIFGTTLARAQTAPPRPRPLASAEIQPDGSVTFRLRAAQAKEVTLRGQWLKEPQPLTRGGDGDWSVTVEQVPAGVWEYSFQVDGLNVLDAVNPVLKPQREPSKSILHIAGTPPNAWDWQGVPHGTVHQHAYDSKALGRRRDLWVYTPPGYERPTTGTLSHYPLLVLQHGS